MIDEYQRDVFSENSIQVTHYRVNRRNSAEEIERWCKAHGYDLQNYQYQRTTIRVPPNLSLFQKSNALQGFMFIQKKPIVKAQLPILQNIKTIRLKYQKSFLPQASNQEQIPVLQQRRKTFQEHLSTVSAAQKEQNLFMTMREKSLPKMQLQIDISKQYDSRNKTMYQAKSLTQKTAQGISHRLRSLKPIQPQTQKILTHRQLRVKESPIDYKIDDIISKKLQRKMFKNVLQEKEFQGPLKIKIPQTSYQNSSIQEDWPFQNRKVVYQKEPITPDRSSDAISQISYPTRSPFVFN